MSRELRILEYAMEMEKQGEKFYLKYKDDVEDKQTKKLFENLAKIENEHYNILKKHFDILSEGGDWSVMDSDLSGGEEIFENVMKEEELLSKDYKSNLSDLAIMRMAYLIENDFANFYDKAVETAEGEYEKKLLKYLSKWEHKHRELFYKEFKDLMEDNWFEQKFYPF
ncbi:ferritin-like domain-containing protein [Dethiothermospora halolimnae]|uniref:ferritin-like domain-containing protein n=1 Tax=Dethiothermospora halolimnae TaxID=3114390 RepID=UPI003CCBCDB6